MSALNTEIMPTLTLPLLITQDTEFCVNFYPVLKCKQFATPIDVEVDVALVNFRMELTDV